jgi:hypothetical protein
MSPSIRTPIPMLILRFAGACLLGVATALLVSCGSSGKALIPAADAGPLKSDFEAVTQDAKNGNGSCADTEAAILQTQRDFGALPSTVDSGLHERLQEGIKNLRERALELCAQPHPQVTSSTATSPRSTTGVQTTSTTPTVTQGTSTQATPPATTPTTSSTGGGTPAPGENEGQPAAGSGKGGSGNEQGNSGGAGQGGRESTPGSGGRESEGGGAGAGGQEGGK